MVLVQSIDHRGNWARYKAGGEAHRTTPTPSGWQGQRGALGGVLVTVSGLLAEREPEAAAVLLGAAENLAEPMMQSVQVGQT